MMTADLVKLEKKEGIAIVTLNRPDVLNALSSGLFSAIADTFEALTADRSIDAVILSGAGRAFCVGLDLNEVKAAGSGFDQSRLNEAGGRCFRAIEGFDRPIIGAINGPAVTGGLEIALVCDILFAVPEAQFADTHIRVGILPGGGLSQKLSRIIGLNRAKELSLSGNFLTAEKAENWGLVNRVVQKEELIPACMDLARDFQSNPQKIVCDYKRLIDNGYQMDLKSALAYEVSNYLETSGDSAAGFDDQRQASVKQRGKQQV